MVEPPYISFYHAGIYLGNNKVCHYSKEKNGIEISSWSEFVRRGEN
jgi:cell wall-associated NlpC family hydrolase